MPITDEVREKIKQMYPEKFEHCDGGHHNMFGLCDVNFYERLACNEGYSLALAELEVLKAENERLKQWKKEAMPMMEDFQAIGKALGIPLGQSIHDKILPGIEAKDKRIAELEGLVRVAHDTGFVAGFNADKSKPRIQNSWDEFKQQHNL